MSVPITDEMAERYRHGKVTMFEKQTITIKSGSGSNNFEATVNLDTMATDRQTQIVMDGLRNMQKDRMQWAGTQAESAKR